MSKTKKYKYFRKNRQNRNRTRKMQGGITNPFKKFFKGKTSSSSETDGKPLLGQSNEENKPQNKVEKEPWWRWKRKEPAATQEAKQVEPAAQHEPDATPTTHGPNAPKAHNPDLDPAATVAAQAQGEVAAAYPGAAPVSAVTPPVSAVTPLESQQTYGNSKTPPYMTGPMGNGLGYQSREYESNANQVSSGSSVPNISDSKPILTSFTPKELKKMPEEEKIAYLSRIANARNKALENPDPRIALLANTIPDAILGRLASIGSESQENLVKEETLVQFTKNFGKMMEDSDKVKELVREYNELLTEEIKEIYREIEDKGGRISEENEKDINELQNILKSNIAFINQLDIQPSLLRHAYSTGSLAAAGSQYATPDPSPPSSKSDKQGFFSRMGEKLRNFGNRISRKNKDNNNYQKLAYESEDKNKEPGFFKRMFSRKNKKVATGPSAGTPAETQEGTPAETPEGETQTEETPDATHTRERNEQDELLSKQRAKRVQNGLIPRFKRGVTEKYDSAKNAVKRGFTNLKQKFSKDTTDETQPLLDNTNRSNGTAAQKKTWRDKLTFEHMKESASKRVESLRTTAKNVKEAATSAMNRITRKKGSTEENTTLLSGDKGIEMRDMTVSQPGPEAQTTVTSARPPPPPPSSPKKTEGDDDKPVNKKLKVVINEINNSQTQSSPFKIQPLAPPPPPLTTRRRDLNVQAAGGKTRKNRQYIHEIKENRTHLFNKEMQILNSIRNFKHGQHHGPNERGKNKPENIQKKFIKVIKRS
jgi:hypothetical protein